MRYWRVPPSARLQPHVLCYFAALQSPTRESAERLPADIDLLLPDGYAELVFILNAGYERRVVGEKVQCDVMHSSYIIGGRSHSVLTRTFGGLVVLGVKLDPRVLRVLIGTPLSEFRDATLSLRDLNNKPLLDLEDALAGAQSVAEVGSTFDRFFLKALTDFRPSKTIVDHLLQDVQRERGAFSIMQWMRDQGTDSRNFEKRFCSWIGMTPKRYARIVRFKHSYYRFLSGEAKRGAVGSHLDDYYDQSHFHRDFRSFVGVAPSIELSTTMPHATDISNHLIQSEFEARSGRTAAAKVERRRFTTIQ
jgi:AraC-like DNA-binding protein